MFGLRLLCPAGCGLDDAWGQKQNPQLFGLVSYWTYEVKPSTSKEECVLP